MDKFLAMGMSVDEVIRRSTWNPAREILGNLSVGAPADVTVLSRETGKFGFTDMYGARLQGTQKLVCEITVRGGKVVYDLTGTTRTDGEQLTQTYLQPGDPPDRCGR